MTVTINGTTGITSPEVVLDNAAADGGQVVLKSSGYSNWNWDNYSGRLRAYYNATEYFTIDTSGNVGIGTSSPLSRFQVKTATNVNVGFQTSANDATGLQINAYNDAGNAGIPLWLVGSYLGFSVAGTERGRFDSSGNLLVGASSAANNERLRVDGAVASHLVRFYNTGGTPYGPAIVYSGANPNGSSNEFLYCQDSVLRASIRSNGGLANYSANNVNLSDRREKTNFAPAKNYLDTICAIPVQTFNYIDQNVEEDPGETLGVVAQDVQAVAPELVMESNWGTTDDPKMRLSIYQTDLQYALMKCIQELNAKIDSLQETVTAQAAKIEALEAKNA